MIRTLPIALALLTMTATVGAAEDAGLTRGQEVYVPVYSHVLHGNQGRGGAPETMLLSTMLSIRNTDAHAPITVRSARYYDTEGRLLRDYCEKPVTLRPMASTDLFVEHKDAAGGTGANFLVVWDAEAPVNPPLIETVHANFFGSIGAIFATRGQPVIPPGKSR